MIYTTVVLEEGVKEEVFWPTMQSGGEWELKRSGQGSCYSHMSLSQPWPPANDPALRPLDQLSRNANLKIVPPFLKKLGET